MPKTKTETSMIKPDPKRVALERLGKLVGVMPSYTDGENEIRASDQGLATVIRILCGSRITIDPETAQANEIEEAADNLADQLKERWLEPVLVSWADRPALAFVRDDHANSDAVDCQLTTEGGEVIAWTADLTQAKKMKRRAPEGGRCPIAVFDIPGDVPIGYHTLQVTRDGKNAQALFLRAPRHGYEHEHAQTERMWGLFAPTYAIRSDRDTGMGDLTDLRSVADVMFERGGKILGTLPLVASRLTKPIDPSPYAPISKRYFSELMIDPVATDEYTNCEQARAIVENEAWHKEVQELRQTDTVDWERQYALRRPVLDALANCFFEQGGHQSASYQAFIEQMGDMEEYALFRAQFEREQAGWTAWSSPDLDESLRESPAYRTHLYAQYAFRRQLDEIATRFREAGGFMYLDLPLGVTSGGYDTWAHRSVYELDLTVGAPPDAMFDHGQSWGLPAVHPERLRETGYACLIESARSFMAQADYLRLDHVMGVHRLYVTPRGLDPTHGVYISYAQAEQFAVLNIESHREQCQLIGENLGMVPQEVNNALVDHAYGSMYIAQLFARNNAKASISDVPVRCVASLNTHDMPPFHSWWNGKDILDLVDLDLTHKQEVSKKDQERTRLTESLGSYLAAIGLLDPEEDVDAETIMQALTARLASSPAHILLINAEDLWGETRWQNVPGTMTEHNNWRHRWAITINELREDEAIADLLSEVTHRQSNPPMPDRAKGKKNAPAKTVASGGGQLGQSQRNNET
ncbi:MAG: 4-alpha-glucanotransferase [Planctomycetota bacterium]